MFYIGRFRGSVWSLVIVVWARYRSRRWVSSICVLTSSVDVATVRKAERIRISAVRCTVRRCRRCVLSRSRSSQTVDTKASGLYGGGVAKSTISNSYGLSRFMVFKASACGILAEVPILFHRFRARSKAHQTSYARRYCLETAILS